MQRSFTSASTKIVLHLSADDSPKFAKQLQLESPILLQNLKEGQAYVQTPTHNVGVSGTIPLDPVVTLPTPIPTKALKTLSKGNFGKHQNVPMVEVEEEQPAKQPASKPKKPDGVKFD